MSADSKIPCGEGPSDEHSGRSTQVEWRGREEVEEGRARRRREEDGGEKMREFYFIILRSQEERFEQGLDGCKIGKA